MSSDFLGKELYAQFLVQILTAAAPRIYIRANNPQMLEVMMAGGTGALKQVTIAGDMTFSLGGVTITAEKNALVAQIVPQQRQEFRHAMVREKDFDKFQWQLVNSGGVKSEGWSSWNTMLKNVLQLKEKKTGKTFQELLDAAISVEKKKYVASQLESHSEFGSW